MKNVLTPLAKSVCTPLGLKPAMSATNIVIQKKIFESGMTTPIIPNKQLMISRK